jgi:hypothetical protein
MFLDAAYACHLMFLLGFPLPLGTLNAPDRRRFKGPIRRTRIRDLHGWVEPFGGNRYLSLKGAAMTQADHYRDQSNRAKRLAKAVKDPEASQKLIEMAEEFRLYAERLEQTH